MGPQGNILIDRHMRDYAQATNPALVPANMEDIVSCSLDLRTGDKAWHLMGIPSLAKGFSFAECIKHMRANVYENLQTLWPNAVMLMELTTDFALPKTTWGKGNPKSSSGRLDLKSIIASEGGTAFNVIPPGYDQRLFLILVSESLYVEDIHGQDMVQVRLYDGPSRPLWGGELEMLHRSCPLVDNIEPTIVPEGLILHLDLESYYPEYLVSTSTRKPISIKARGVDPTGYFYIKPMGSGNILYLDPGEFLLASSIESIRVPPYACVEMVPYHEEFGEYLSHKAGYFDAGFGYGRNGESESATVVFEIRNISNVSIGFKHGQRIGLCRYEYLRDVPDLVYGEKKGGKISNYQSQRGVRLAKQFAPWPNAHTYGR
ncbi:MAG: 2'-deoxycytidine 5'-triphosphate deaminase [Candidatus Doudnabacteria bacterium]|nr:2'-deoxycytidine 5'-triphosphate deaminase [Candidatus Doudnabacteria bacterium]